MKGVIYKITSPTGLIYIGQTTDFEKRMRRYKKDLAKGQDALHNSFIKHGFESHCITVVEEVYEGDLHDRERHYIQKHNSVNKGLNIHLGGKGGRTWQDSDKKDSVLEKLRNRRGALNPNYGNRFSHSELTKERMRQNNNCRKGVNHPKAKSYICIETGEVFPMVKLIAERYNVTPVAVTCAFRRSNNRFRGMHFQLAHI